jgi:hypothetical protein
MMTLNDVTEAGERLQRATQAYNDGDIDAIEFFDIYNAYNQACMDFANQERSRRREASPAVPE